MKLRSLVFRAPEVHPSTTPAQPTPLVISTQEITRLCAEIRALIEARGAAIRKTAASVALVLMLGATPAWARCATAELGDGHEEYWCQYSDIDLYRTRGVYTGLAFGVLLGLIPGILLGGLASWRARTKAAMAEEMLSNVRVHLREAPRSYDAELDALDRRRP